MPMQCDEVHGTDGALCTDVDYYLYSPAHNKTVFVSNDYESGDNVVEAKSAKEGRSIIKLSRHGKGYKIYTPSHNKTLFLSGDKKNGDHIVEAKRGVEGRSECKIFPHGDGYTIYFPSYKKYLFVSNDYRQGDNIVEGKGSVERRSIFHFIPTNYKLHARIYDFEFTSNVQHDLQRAMVKDFAFDDTMHVGKELVGCSVGTTFTKNVSETFSWSHTQKLGVSVTAEYDVGVPLIGGAKSKLTFSTELSNTQTHSKTSAFSFSATSQMIPKEKGTYRKQGWVWVAENVSWPFKAKAKLRARFQNQWVNPVAVKAFYRSEGLEAKIKEVGDEWVLVELTGTMNAKYGCKTETSFKKIS